MWMTQYICEIKKQMASKYHFKPIRVEFGEPIFNPSDIPDGTYPMVIDGQRDNVRVVDGKIHCCNFEEGK